MKELHIPLYSAKITSSTKHLVNSKISKHESMRSDLNGYGEFSIFS